MDRDPCRGEDLHLWPRVSPHQGERVLHASPPPASRPAFDISDTSHMVQWWSEALRPEERSFALWSRIMSNA